MHIFGKNNERAPVPEASGVTWGWGGGRFLSPTLFPVFSFELEKEKMVVEET